MIQLQPIIQADQLNQLAALLRLSMGGTNQKETFAAIKQLEDRPQSYLYFLALLISPLYQENLRELAGLALKNMLKRNMQTLPATTLNIVKSVIFQQYDLHQGRVLKTFGLILGLIVQEIKFDNDCIGFLLDRAQKQNIFAIETLKRIVEDCKTGSENMSMLNSQKFASLVERLIQILLPQCEGANKEYAIDCFNMIIYPMPVSMINSLHCFLRILMVELLNPNPVVVMRAMEGFEAIASTRKDLITDQVVLLVATTNFQNQKTIKVQANFWIQVLDSDGSELVKPVLGHLLQKWIVGMILTKDDIASIMQTDMSNLQKQEDIIQDEYQQEGETAKGGDYTLRKLCGIIISKLSLLFSEQLWDASKKLVSALIQQNCWMRQELAILYIGLIADNCGQQVKQNFKQIVQTISQVMTSTTQHLLKSTCLWTLSKYTVQIVELSRLDSNILSGYITMILNSLEDSFSNVRSAACTTLTSLIHQIKDNIVPWLPTILTSTSKALLTYKGNSLYCLFQFYESLASDLSESQFSGELTQQILVPLCSKWSSLGNNDRDLCPLLQSLVVLCGKTKKSIAPYTSDLYNKSMELFNSKDKQIFLRIIDLLQEIIKGAPVMVRQQILKSDLVGRTIQQVREGDPEIKLACYSLLSVLSEFVEFGNPLLVMSEVFNSINSKKQSQVNNALFCMAELIKNYPQISDFAEPSAKLAIQFLLKAGGTQRNVYFINFSKIIGLIAAVHPHKVAPHLKVFFKDFCRAIRASSQHNPKLHQAVLGVIKMIQMNPEGVLDDFKYFVEMGVCLRNAPQENTTAFRHLLRLYKDRIGSHNWEVFLNDSYFLPGAVNKIQQYVM